MGLSVPAECGWKLDFMRVCGELLGIEGQPEVNPLPTVAEPLLNQKQEQEQKQDKSAPPDGVPKTVWQDFQKLRKAKRAPITDTAIDGIRLEAEKAGMSLGDALAMCCKRGWQGFEAGWVNGAHPAGRSAKAPGDDWTRAAT